MGIRRIPTTRVEVVWHRSRTPGTENSTVQFRRGGEEWKTLNTLDELPDDARALVQDFFPSNRLDEPQLTSVRVSRRRRSKRRHRPAVGQKGRFELEYVWLDGWALVCCVIAVPAVLYYSWDGLNGTGLTWLFAPAGFLLSALLAYYGLAVLVNRTLFEIADGRLTVRHGPLPWPGARSLKAAEVEQLYCYASRRRNSCGYNVVAITTDGRSVRLLDDIRTPDEAVSIERAIERHLGIPDWPELGEKPS